MQHADVGAINKRKGVTPVDPVCGKRMKRQRAHATIEYEGQVYYLCCRLCQAEFGRNPEKYARRAG